MRKILAGMVYRHFKGKDYKVLVVAQHTETGEQCVVYQAHEHPSSPVVF